MKYVNSLFMISLRQAFLYIVPFYVLSSIGILLSLIENPLFHQNDLVTALVYLSEKFSYVFPFLLISTISYRFGKNYNVNFFFLSLLSLFIFLVLSTSFNPNETINFYKEKTILAIFIPIVTLFLFIFFQKITIFNIIKEDTLHHDLRATINSIIPIILIFILLTLFIPYLEQSIQSLFIHNLSQFLPNTDLEHKTFFQILFVQLIWWLTGIHGTHIYSVFMDTSYLQNELFPHITSEIFIFNFVMIGGAGSTLSLIIAILLYSKNKSSQKIAWLSLPFGIFNINEILLFGLPIILNLHFLIPFIFIPVFNFLTNYIYLSFFPIEAFKANIAWSTPVFLSGYQLGNGSNFTFIFLQLFNLIAGVLIYKKYLLQYDHDSSNVKIKDLENKFNINHNIKYKENYEVQSSIEFYNHQQEILKKQNEMNNMMDLLITSEFLLYYQPQIDIDTNRCCGFESLLRLKKKDGSIIGPYFIPIFEENGYSYIIDYWVIQQVAHDYPKFLEKIDNPKISINLSPQSITNDKILQTIIDKLSNYNIEIEILERTFITNDTKFFENLHKLKKNNFTISVDDFGAGYSSLQYLHTLPVDKIKIDKALLDGTNNKKGQILYQNIVTMCFDLGYQVLAEGVETKDNIIFLRKSNVRTVQGYYYHKALALEDSINIKEIKL